MHEAVTTHNLSKVYRGKTALHPLDLNIRPGTVTGYLGPNGAGKTTTLRLLLGLSQPTTGTVQIFGVNAGGPRANDGVAFIPNSSPVWPGMTGMQVLDLFASVRGTRDVKRRASLIDRFDLDPSKRMRTYSTGNLQKVSIIAAFEARPRLLFCDEPTTGLDPLMGKTFLDEVRELKEQEGTTVVLSSHILGEVEALADRVLIISGGRIVDDGTIQDLQHLQATTVVAEFTEVPADLEDVPGVLRIERLDNRRVSFEVSGDLGTVVSSLAGPTLVDLRTQEPTLEEVFFAHYSPLSKGDER